MPTANGPGNPAATAYAVSWWIGLKSPEAPWYRTKSVTVSGGATYAPAGGKTGAAAGAADAGISEVRIDTCFIVVTNSSPAEKRVTTSVNAIVPPRRPALEYCRSTTWCAVSTV